ncbi:MAG: hypothetical protein CSA21_04020 [Deltaproteobacteria bacterium]|nr:MAG: hypothetical protein CSA21_04020 [Deltaproteobacteria bacterium]
MTVLLLVTGLDVPSGPEQAIPGDAIALLEWDDPLASLERFRHSPAGEVLLDPSLAPTLNTTGMSAEKIRALEMVRQFCTQIESTHPLSRYMRKRVVVALLPAEPGEDNVPMNLVAAMLSPKIVPSKWFIRTLRKRFDGLSTSFQGLHQGAPIYRIQYGNLVALVSWCRGVILAGLREHTLHRCIDRILESSVNRPGGPEANVQRVQLQEHSEKKEDLLFAADLEVLPDFPGRTWLEPLLKPGGKIGLYHRRAGSEDRFTLIHRFPSTREGVFAELPAPTLFYPGPEQLFSNQLVYVQSNLFSLERLWQAAASSSNPDIATAAFFVAMRAEEYTGMSLDELFRLFGPEIGLLVDRFMTNGFFPVPRPCLFFGIKNPQEVQRMMATVLHHLPVITTRLDDTVVYSLQLAGGLMQPSYCIIGSSLVVADNREQIEDLLSSADKTRLVEDQMYRRVDVGLSKPSNLLAFVRTAAVNDSLKELALWIVSVLETDEEQGVGKRIFVKRLVLPLLDSIKHFKAKGIRGYIKDDSLIMDAALAS